MTLKKYCLSVLTLTLLVGFVPSLVDRSHYQDAMFYAAFVAMLVVVPILRILRMRYLKMTWKEMLLGLIPFYGLAYRFRVFGRDSSPPS